MQFAAVVIGPIDGDSIWVERDGKRVGVRVGGVDVPSKGAAADAARAHIRTWAERQVTVKEGCCGRPHGEIPGIVTDAQGNNLGKELLTFGWRLSRFPLEAVVQRPPLLLRV